MVGLRISSSPCSRSCSRELLENYSCFKGDNSCSSSEPQWRRFRIVSHNGCLGSFIIHNKKALRVIRKTGTLQEYRRNMEAFGKSGKDGFTKMKQIEYWAFHDIVGEKKQFLIRVIVRRIGDGKIHFWSVMPHGKIERQRLYQGGIEVD